MGHNINELVLHGHIYINWDGLADSNITIVTNPKKGGGQRQWFYDGPEVSKQYWGTIRGNTLPLKADAVVAPST
ncbi:hypothetical protein QBC32DRAFT_316500 [Pseudoneurospora amorphoporcata]|uniref:Uncharacterized protein n=1 Tax=Pseudoneurospora amorphoporcata TaxID=241081 RepID=A0AAN6SEA3_9PEZI|nr:hypothetical protein QBC32DRAFT_316500 [Pseudoneurospora amorphoporcata]